MKGETEREKKKEEIRIADFLTIFPSKVLHLLQQLSQGTLMLSNNQWNHLLSR